MPSAHKYESNGKALVVYLRAYGDGYERGCSLVTTDYSPPPEMVYTNDNPLLQAAGVDGFEDGRVAAMKMVATEIRELKKHTVK